MQKNCVHFTTDNIDISDETQDGKNTFSCNTGFGMAEKRQINSSLGNLKT